MSVTKLQSKEDISAAIYRALVEVFTLRDAGMEVVIPNAVGDDRGVEAISTARIVQGEHGVPTVTYASAELQQEAFAALMPIPEEEAVAPEDVVREAKGIEDEEIVEEIETEAHNEEVLRAEEQASEIQAQEEDVFESEEQGGDEAMAATVTQATTPVKASVKRKAEWLVFFNDVPTGQWVNTAFPTAEVKFAVSLCPWRIDLFPSCQSSQLPRFSNESCSSQVAASPTQLFKTLIRPKHSLAIWLKSRSLQSSRND